MAYTLVQAGNALKLLDESGVATTLTLPTGITLKTDTVPRFTRFGRYVVLVNTPNRPLSIDAGGKVRVLTPLAPSTAHTLVAGTAGGSIFGRYRTRQTFVIRDDAGNTISESEMGPTQPGPVPTVGSGGTAISNQAAYVSNLSLSGEDVTGTNIYRTLAYGDVWFLWRELDGNVQTTSDEDKLPDSYLSIFAAPVLGTPPDLTLVTEWRGRLWGVGRVDVDTLVYTETGSMYAWPAANGISIPPLGLDTRGVTALIARRDSLVVGRRTTIKQVTGTSNRDFRVVGLSDETGIESNESVAVWEGVVYFLGTNGVYTLDGSNLTCISDGKTRSWFATDTYFDRSRFRYATGYIDPVRLKYRLFLASRNQVGTIYNDRWVEYDIQTKTWWGPHKTDAFTPSTVISATNSSDQTELQIGSTGGYLFREQATATDDTATGIAFDVITGFDSQGSPNAEKFWGRLSVLGKVQTAGTMQVTPTIGGLTATAKLAMHYVMSLGSQVLGYLGIGALLKLRFQHSTAGEPVELYGYEIEDVHELGNR